MPTLCLRFDVDSHRCLAEGVPALLDLLDEHRVPATFYVNMGRLTSRPRMARRAVERRLGRADNTEGADAPKATLPLSAKLGRDGIVRVVLANPRVGAAMPATVAEIARRGHEVGLHGGRSHRLWQDDAGDWSRAKLASEIGWGLGRLAAAGVPEPAGFSSPGWNGSPLVARVAADHGFRYLADDHGHGPATVAPGPEGLVRVSTNLVGEPGGVGYLEWHRALGHDDDEILRDVAERLGGSGDLAVLYDHPFYAGIFELDLLGRVIEQARSSGWQLDTIGDVAARAA